MMKMTDAYKITTSRTYRIVTNIICGIVGAMLAFVLVAILNAGEEFGGIEFDENTSVTVKMLLVMYLFAGVLAVIMVFSDYFVFAGTADKNKGTMNYLRSSYNGKELIKKGVIGDFVYNAVRSFLAVPFIGIVTTSIIIGRCELGVVFGAISVWAAMLISITASNIIIRRYAKTLLNMVAFTYLSGGIYVLAIGLLGLVASCVYEFGFNQILMVVIAVVLLAVAMMFFTLGKRDMIKCYESGFIDKVGGDM